jgi:hypothetical protein
MEETVNAIVIEQMGSKEVKTRFGPKQTYSFKAGGAWYNAGWKKPTFAVGDTISFRYEESTYGKDVVPTSISVHGKTGAAAPTHAAGYSGKPAPSVGSKGVFPIPPLDGQRAIVRQNAVTNARELYCAVGNYHDTDIKEDVKIIIEVARMFEAYSCGDTDMADAVAEMKGKDA